MQWLEAAAIVYLVKVLLLDPLEAALKRNGWLEEP